MIDLRDKAWLRLLIVTLILPLLVGLTIALINFGLPRFFERGKELSFSIDGPTTYLEPGAIGRLNVEVNGVKTSSLIGYKVRLWNSGGLPLANLPVRFVFETDRTEFRVFSVSHNTTPAYEFGEIREEGSNSVSKRFVYALMNAGDEDIVTFLTNDSAIVTLYAKAEGLTMKQIKPTERLLLSNILSVVVAGLGTAVATGLAFWSGRRLGELFVERSRQGD